MKVYLDYIFLENLIVNIVVILETIKLTKFKLKNNTIKFILICIIESILSIVINSICISVICTILNIVVLFKPKKIVNIFKITVIYYLVYIVFIGVVILISNAFNIYLENILNKIIIYCISGIFSHLFISDMWKMWKSNISKESIYYTLVWNGEKIPVFVDTGNSVKDYISGLDVIFLDYKYKYLALDLDSVSLDIKTVNGESDIEGYIVKDVEIYKGDNKVAKIDKILFAFELKSEEPEKYSGLLGYDLYLEKLEGVIL